MTITFPRDFPAGDLPFRACSFEPIYLQARAPTRGGLQQVVDLGPALWQMRYETVPLAETQAELWKAWLHSLRGGLRTFKAWNPLRRYAIAYRSGYAGLTRSGGGSFAAGTATLTAIGAERDTITLSTLPASFKFTTGDLVSIPMGSSRVLVRVLESATASGAGAATVTVEPFLPLAVTTGVTVDLASPWCLGVLDPASVSGPWTIGQRSSIIFSATQAY